MPLHDVTIKQKMANTIVMFVIDDNHAAEVYQLQHPHSILQHLRRQLQPTLSVNIGVHKKRVLDYLLADGSSMLECIKTNKL